MRKPFQGIWNIIHFNWPYYALSLGLVLLILLVRNYANRPVLFATSIMLILIIGLSMISLLVSWYVYDLSRFYELDWLERLDVEKAGKIVNINAGFDETSNILADKFKDAELIVYDFFDPAKHTEASIRRARKTYPPYPGTRVIPTDRIPLKADSVDGMFLILSAHEIRDAEERTLFFSELRRTVSRSGRIVVVEHLRDLVNYLAYNIGAFHFHSRSAWLTTFESARLNVESEERITPFITAFFLSKNGIES
jgi:hypothetical protein